MKEILDRQVCRNIAGLTYDGGPVIYIVTTLWKWNIELKQNWPCMQRLR